MACPHSNFACAVSQPKTIRVGLLAAKQEKTVDDLRSCKRTKARRLGRIIRGDDPTNGAMTRQVNKEERGDLVICVRCFKRRSLCLPDVCCASIRRLAPQP